MKISSIMSASLAAIVLASSASMPAAAHGTINYIEHYFEWNYTDPYNPYYDEVGRRVMYCDGHQKLIGSMAIDSEREDITVC